MIADLKHSLIDPQGDFVKLSSVDNEAKTVVISDEELGEIKHTPKNRGKKPEVAQLEEEVYDTDYDDGDDDEYFSKGKSSKKKKKKSSSRLLSIMMLLVGAAILVCVIIFVGQTSGLIGGNGDTQKESTESTADSQEDDNMVEVPDLVGKTESEATELLEAVKLGKQMMGEENSTQQKGKISSQDIPEGTKVEKYTTVKYYISKGQQQITIPGVSGQTGVDAQQTLEDLGLTVTVQKEYSEDDGTGHPLVEPGYAMSVSPEEGTSVSAGDAVTLNVSRGLDWGDSASVPSVVGMTKNDAITALGKWLDIQVQEEQNSEVPAGEVIAQSIEAETAADPDQPITITVSSGDQAPAAEEDQTSDTAADTFSDTESTADTAQQSEAAANGEVWKCTQALNTPKGYQGGAIRLELIQEVNGESKSSKIVDGEKLEFPYTLDVTGEPGVSEGTLYVSELINGNFQQLGTYPLTFKKAE